MTRIGNAGPGRVGKAPFPYYGAKQYLADTLADLLPPHEVYCEVFGGGGSLLFTKSPSKTNIYNDLESGVVNFFRVLRDVRLSRELIRLLDLTPYSREEWEECRSGWWHAASDVEMARQWFVAIVGSFGKHLSGGTGWSFSKTPGHDKAHSFRSATEALPVFTRRLRYVQVEHGDFAHMLKVYDGPTTLFYCDPPYMAETRANPNRYRHEMSTDDHERLLEMLNGIGGMAVLSGYRSDLYDARLGHWRRVEVTVLTSTANRRREKRIECIWLNPACQHAQPSLFAGLDGMGMGVAG